MEKSYYLSTTFNEVIFKDRNKLYGAYQLRRLYNKNISLAVLFATAVFGTALATPIVKEKLFPSIENQLPEYDDHGTVVLDDLILPPIEQPKAKEEVIVTAPEKVKTEVYKTMKVVPNDANVEEKTLANQEDLKDAVFGDEKIDGIKAPIPDAVITNEAPTGIGSGDNAEPANGIFITVEEMPEFEGGEGAMLKYIGRKINYPTAAQRENIQGLVVVTFVVSPTGEINDAQVLKGLGYGTDEEALRVVKGMPKWKPGRQNGRTVAVRYTLPIRFSMR